MKNINSIFRNKMLSTTHRQEILLLLDMRASAKAASAMLLASTYFTVDTGHRYFSIRYCMIDKSKRWQHTAQRASMFQRMTAWSTRRCRLCSGLC